MLKLILVLLVVIITLPCFAGDIFPVPMLPYAPLTYQCYRAIGKITVDGKLDELDWQYASKTTDFVDIEGSLKPLPDQQTNVKMLWNDKGLYIGAVINEKDVWATLKERDSVIFHDNDFEVFIDPDGDTHDYYELEVNALATLWDLFLIMPYRDRDQVAVNSWDVRNIELAVNVNGTLNNPADTDSSWTVEMMLPWNVLGECAHKPCPPNAGDYWRMNFSRVEWKTDVIDGKYVKKPGVPESNWVWSPQGLIAMHYPERWGYVIFEGSSPLNIHVRAYTMLPSEAGKEYLRQLYYKQKQYWNDNHKYAKKLSTLDAKPYIYNGKKVPVKIETTSLSYIITLKGTKDFNTIHIREDGLTW